MERKSTYIVGPNHGPKGAALTFPDGHVEWFQPGAIVPAECLGVMSGQGIETAIRAQHLIRLEDGPPADVGAIAFELLEPEQLLEMVVRLNGGETPADLPEDLDGLRALALTLAMPKGRRSQITADAVRADLERLAQDAEERRAHAELEKELAAERSLELTDPEELDEPVEAPYRGPFESTEGLPAPTVRQRPVEPPQEPEVPEARQVGPEDPEPTTEAVEPPSDAEPEPEHAEEHAEEPAGGTEAEGVTAADLRALNKADLQAAITEYNSEVAAGHRDGEQLPTEGTKAELLAPLLEALGL